MQLIKYHSISYNICDKSVIKFKTIFIYAIYYLMIKKDRLIYKLVYNFYIDYNGGGQNIK